jgi:mRNA-degrading endonuclease YafQ of YafQ-DinJ toxin-antitoxin module
VPEVEIPPSFKKVARKKQLSLQLAIARCVELLADNPRHPGLQAHRVQGSPGVWEAYVDRANRVTFHYDAGKIVIRKNCNHEILKRP